MKKCLPLLLALFLLWVCIPAAMAHYEPIAEVQILQDHVYLLNYDDLLVYDSSGLLDAPNIHDYPDISWYNSRFATDGEQLYIVDPTQPALYRLEENVPQLVVKLEPLSGVWLTSPVVQGNFLYLLARNMENVIDYQLYRFALDTGKAEHMQVENCLFWEIAPGAEGQLLGWDENGRRVVAFDSITGLLIADTGRLPTYNVGGLCYDSASGCAYYIQDTELIRWDGQETVSTDFIAVESAISIIHAGICNGEYVAADRYRFYTSDMAGGNTKEGVVPLNIYYSDSSLYYISQQIYGFMQDYTNINVYLHSYAPSDLSECLQEADLIVLSSQDKAPVSLLQQLDSTNLKKDVAAMYPQISSYLVKENVLYGYPIYPWTSFLSYDLATVEDAPQNIHMYYAVVPLASPHRTEAIRFLEYYSLHQPDYGAALLYPKSIKLFGSPEAAKAYQTFLKSKDAILFPVWD